MVLLGLLLIGAGSAALALVFAQPTLASTSFTLLDRPFAVTGVEMFLAGAVTALTLLLGMTLVVKGLHRNLALRQHRHRVDQRTREKLARLEEEKRDLQLQVGQSAHPNATQQQPSTPRSRRRRPLTSDRLVAGSRRNPAATR